MNNKERKYYTSAGVNSIILIDFSLLFQINTLAVFLSNVDEFINNATIQDYFNLFPSLLFALSFLLLAIAFFRKKNDVFMGIAVLLLSITLALCSIKAFVNMPKGSTFISIVKNPYIIFNLFNFIAVLLLAINVFTYKKLSRKWRTSFCFVEFLLFSLAAIISFPLFMYYKLKSGSSICSPDLIALKSTDLFLLILGFVYIYIIFKNLKYISLSINGNRFIKIEQMAIKGPINLPHKFLSISFSLFAFMGFVSLFFLSKHVGLSEKLLIFYIRNSSLGNLELLIPAVWLISSFLFFVSLVLSPFFWAFLKPKIVYNAPTQNVPVQNTQVQNTPVQNVPVQNTPVPNVPVQNTPVQNTPIQNTPVQNTPVQNTPVQNTPIQNTPVQNTPVQNAQVKQDNSGFKQEQPVCEPLNNQPSVIEEKQTEPLLNEEKTSTENEKDELSEKVEKNENKDTPDNSFEKAKQLKSLLDLGILTEEEYNKKMKELFNLK